MMCTIVLALASAYVEDGIRDGRFRAMMQVYLVNNGPLTIQLDSSKSNSGFGDLLK